MRERLWLVLYKPLYSGKGVYYRTAAVTLAELVKAFAGRADVHMPVKQMFRDSSLISSIIGRAVVCFL